MTREREIDIFFDGTIESVKEIDVKYHWIPIKVLPEDIVRISKINRFTDATDRLLVYNSSLDNIEINRRVKIRGEWVWQNDNGTITHWALLPLSPFEQKDELNIIRRKNILGAI